MKVNTLAPTNLSRYLVATVWAVFFAVSVGAAAPDRPNVQATDRAKPDASEHSFLYKDRSHGFSLRLPVGVKRGVYAEPDGQVVFSGFALPQGTNLVGKRLIIVSGNYDMLEGAEPIAPFTSDGVVFKRVMIDDGSAGHSTLHVIYTWQKGNNELHFDFTHRATDLLILDPSERPKEYNRTAQIKLTEKIMSTFKRLRTD